MNKIFLVVGIIFLCSLLFFFLFFVGNIGNFAKLLGETTIEITNEKDRFVGNWVDEKRNMQWYNFSSDGTVSLTDLAQGNYEIKDGRLIVDIVSGVNSSSIIGTVTYDYYFSKNYSKLHLKIINQTEWITYLKQ